MSDICLWQNELSHGELEMFLAGIGDGKIFRAPLYLISPLPRNIGHVNSSCWWLMKLRLSIKNYVSLTVVNENPFSYLPLNTGFVSRFYIKLESWNVSFSLWVMDCYVLGKSIFQICVDNALPVTSISVNSLVCRVSCLPVISFVSNSFLLY